MAASLQQGGPRIHQSTEERRSARSPSLDPRKENGPVEGRATANDLYAVAAILWKVELATS
jgi:hypothetical protein